MGRLGKIPAARTGRTGHAGHSICSHHMPDNDDLIRDKGRYIVSYVGLYLIYVQLIEYDNTNFQFALVAASHGYIFGIRMNEHTLLNNVVNPFTYCNLCVCES